VTIIEQTKWHSHEIVKQTVRNSAGEPIPFYTILPAKAEARMPLVVALHGYTSSKDEWLQIDDYTKGGNLVKALADNGYAVVAIDMYFHGENIHTEAAINYDTLMEGKWEPFFAGTVESVETVLAHVLQTGPFDQDRIGFLSYSLGGVFGVWLANKYPWFKTMVTCVLPAFREDDDEYAPYNNLDNLVDTSLLFIAAQNDEYIAFEDSEWLYAQAPMADKRFLSYESGHSLPVDYVPEAVAWFQQRF
jgi:dienelactone hydrolase